jgi:Ca2+-binding RTX toxin-like protein
MEGLHEKKEKQMRRTICLLTAMVMTLLVATSVAMAATVNCPANTSSNIWCQGTNGDDLMTGTDATYSNGIDVYFWGDKSFGYGGNDTLNARGGPDELDGGPGNDKLFGGEGDDKLIGRDGKNYLSGGPGNDRINAYNYGADGVIYCGSGLDTVTYDRYLDVPAGDCESKTAYPIAAPTN